MLHSAVKVEFMLALLNHYRSKCFGHFLESKEEERRMKSMEQEGWLDRDLNGAESRGTRCTCHPGINDL